MAAMTRQNPFYCMRGNKVEPSWVGWHHRPQLFASLCLCSEVSWQPPKNISLASTEVGALFTTVVCHRACCQRLLPLHLTPERERACVFSTGPQDTTVSIRHLEQCLLWAHPQRHWCHPHHRKEALPGEISLGREQRLWLDGPSAIFHW